MHHGLARQRDAHADGIEHHTGKHDLHHAKALDQMPGEKARSKHADHMPLQHACGGAEIKAAHIHGQRRGGHQQVHDAVAGRSRQRGDRKPRLPKQLAHRALRHAASPCIR
ncbi:hypothetical protein D3C72_1320980 [compost metagenome]